MPQIKARMLLAQWAVAALLCLPSVATLAAPPPPPPRDGAHDFDFLIDYYGISNHHKLLDTNANFEQFDVTAPKTHQHLKGQTLRMYNPASHQWSIYGLDLDKGELGQPPLIGGFEGKRGVLYDQELRGGRIMLVRYVWTDQTPKSALMVQSFSADGGKTWDANWICELSR